MSFCLGRKPAIVRPHQPRLDHHHLMQDRVAPTKLIRGHIDPSPVLADNDEIGDCTAVGLANSIRCLSALNGFSTDTPTPSVIQFYEDSTGYNPSNPSSDQGGVEADILAFAGRNGYALPEQTLYPLWGTIDPGNFNSIRLAAASLGSVYLGVNLAIADQALIGSTWDTDTRLDEGDPTAGSWGGHCLVLWDYDGCDDADTVTLLTWGQKQKATWRWLRSRLEEAHGVLWPQLATPLPGFMSASCLDKLKADNKEFLSGSSVGD